MKRVVCRWPAAIAAAVIVGLGAIAYACNVPVFRFALEKWRPDAYRIVVLHRGPLGDAERELLRPLEEQQDKGLGNVVVETIDVAKADGSAEATAAAEALKEATGKVELPWFVVQYPAQLRIPQPAWAGRLDRENASTIVDSPIRRELARRLAEGQTAVWLLLESGHSEKDDPAAALLEERLKKLEQELELPELTAAPEDAISAALPLKVAFSLLRVPRDAAEERMLVGTLINSEPDLAERSDPMVFPVFGRGRALLALIGAGITEKNIHDAAEFLTGPCSCQVKEQNPGFDLLLSAEWEALLSQGGVSLTAVETRSVPPAGGAELVPIPSGAAPAAALAPTVEVLGYRTTGVSMWAIIGGAGVVCLLVIAGLVAAMQMRGAEGSGR